MDQQPTTCPPTERVQVRLDGAALHIVFNNPARHNALSVDMWGAVPPLLAQAEHDDRVRAGGVHRRRREGLRLGRRHLAVRRHARRARGRQAVRGTGRRGADGHPRFSKPTLACIRGWCIGGGVNVAISLRHPHRGQRRGVLDPGSAAGPGLPLLGAEEPGRPDRRRCRQGPVLHRAPHRCGRGPAPRPGVARGAPEACPRCWPSTPARSARTRRSPSARPRPSSARSSSPRPSSMSSAAAS
jgi:hypothetical protein